MASGYLSFYFTDYSATFTCSTMGALGGAVFVGAFGWGPVGWVSLVRLGYVLAGSGGGCCSLTSMVFPYQARGG